MRTRKRRRHAPSFGAANGDWSCGSLALATLLLLAGCTGEVDDGSRSRGSFVTGAPTFVCPLDGGPCTQVVAASPAVGVAGAGAPPVCNGGVCPCQAGTTICNGACVDFASDAENCGQCGNACTPGSACVAGVCGCPGGGVACNGACVDTTRDLLHCGGCGIACVAGEICDASRCVAATSAACTTSCGGGRSCENGACVCPTTQAFCDGACVDTQSDVEHCGGCGLACEQGQACNGGACACPSGQTLCGASCVDTQTSLQHCGGGRRLRDVDLAGEHARRRGPGVRRPSLGCDHGA